MKKIYILLYLIIFVVLLVVWEQSAKQNNNVRIVISSPSLISNYFAENAHQLMNDVWVTFYESLSGLLIATLVCFASVIFCFYFPAIIRFILPVMIISQVIPLITLAPLFIILMGSGHTAIISMAAVLCYFPVFINFINGYRLIDKSIHELLYVYRADMYQKIRYVYFPLAIPNIMAGLKISATLAVIGAIVAEFSGAEAGVGRNLYISSLRLEPELMMCSLFLSAFLGGAMYGLIYFIESKIGKWYLKKV